MLGKNFGKMQILRIILLFTALVILITGCGADGKTKDHVNSELEANAKNTMGRYMETLYALPKEINRNGGLNLLSDGRMSIIAYDSGLWMSEDQGLNWKQQETAWFPMMQNVYCLDAVMGPDGSVAISCSGKMPKAAREAYGKSVPEDWEGNYCVFAEPNQDFQIVDFGFTQEAGSCIENFCFKEDGRLFASDMNGKVYEVNKNQGTVKELFTAERALGSIGFSGNILAAVGYNKLYLYDLEKQVLLSQDKTADEFVQRVLADEKVSYTGGGYPLSVSGGQEEQILYLACEDGLYRHAIGGSRMEQVIDGALSTFGDSTSVIYNVYSTDNQGFLAFFNPSKGLISYNWDETVPSMPDKEIKIYSLEENKSIRQAATAYKKEHTDLYVRYEVGMEEGNGMTREDALKNLNTEILLGTGPDILVLDGLPYQSYIEKGMLSDLGEVLSGLSGEDALFPNILESLTRDGKIYAMPLCIKVPLLCADQDVVKKITDLTSFADEMENLRKENPTGGLLGIYDAETLLSLFGMTSSITWQKSDGSIDEAAVIDFYQQMLRIYQAEIQGAVSAEIEQLQKIDEELIQYGINPVENKQEICNNVLNIPCGYAKLAAGYVDGIQLCLDNVTSVIRINKGLDYTNFNGQTSGAFLPISSVGVCAQSANQEETWSFIQNIFSKDTQAGLYEGFPVNQAAFLERFDFYEENNSNGSMTLSLKDGTEQELSLYWPDTEERQKFTELVERLKTPVFMDDYISNLVYEMGVQVLEGNISAEAAVFELVKKASIYLAE